MLNKIKVFFNLIHTGNSMSILRILKKRMYSNTEFVLARKDIQESANDSTVKPRIDITLRHYKDSDHIYFENLVQDDMLLAAKIPTCYVAVTKEDIPCYRVWFLDSSQNDKIQDFFGYNFPVLKDDEFILERVHTVEAYRGLYLMVSINNLFIQKARKEGYRWALGFIKPDNYPSLKGAVRSGAKLYKLQITKRRFFTRRTVYVDIPKKYKLENPRLFPNENLKVKK